MTIFNPIPELAEQAAQAARESVGKQQGIAAGMITEIPEGEALRDTLQRLTSGALLTSEAVLQLSDHELATWEELLREGLPHQKRRKNGNYWVAIQRWATRNQNLLIWSQVGAIVLVSSFLVMKNWK